MREREYDRQLVTIPAGPVMRFVSENTVPFTNPFNRRRSENVVSIACEKKDFVPAATLFSRRP